MTAGGTARPARRHRASRAISYILLAMLMTLITALLYLAMRGDVHVAQGLLHLFTRTAPPVLHNPQLPEHPALVSWVADIEDPNLDESSGLTASPQHAGILWSINDSGSAPHLYVLALDGSTRAVYQLNTTDVFDWEAMDSFVLDGVSYLLVADTGDNFRWRKSAVMLIVREPPVLPERVSMAASAPASEAAAAPVAENAAEPQPLVPMLEVAWRIRFTYPEGARDSEAVAVDIARQRILLLSKRHYPAELFSLPLQPEVHEQLLEATHLVDLAGLPQPTVTEVTADATAIYRHMPSGMDVAGDKLLVTTYKHAYLYQLAELPHSPQRISLPTLGQREAVTFTHDSQTRAYISRERRGGSGFADLFRIDLLDASGQKPGAVTADD